jgi:hypothetical protein
MKDSAHENNIMRKPETVGQTSQENQLRGLCGSFTYQNQRQ